MSKASQEKLILKLWRDPNFSGAYSGLSNFQACLLNEKNIKVSRNDLLKMLSKDRNYVLEMRKIPKKIERRPMNAHGYGSVWQSDIAQLYEHDGYTAFLLCIDVYSRRIFCQKLKTKSRHEVETAFKKIFREAGIRPAKLESDQGSEFVSNASFFKQQNIFFKIKVGANKARYEPYEFVSGLIITTKFVSFAEHGILLVKTRLFRLLRTLMTQNWPRYLNQVTLAINNSPNSAIGGLKPALIKSREDGVLIDRKIGFKLDTPVELQKQKQREYEKDRSQLQVGNFVYLDFPPSTMAKSFDTRRNEIFRVRRVDAGKSPPLYKLEDLKKVPVKGYYYAKQLLKTSKPKKGEFFTIEKIVKEKMLRGRPFVLVKYLHYGNQFNKWIPKENILKGAK